ncbi:hypothetical protein ACLBWS_16540 [Brucellaceae bacterium D45D]
MLKFIAAPLKAVSLFLACFEKLILSILNVVWKILGGQMTAESRQIPAVSTTLQDVLSKIQDDVCESGTGYSKLMKPTTDAGHALYRYVNANTVAERAKVDLSSLTHTQQEWLYLLSDYDLQRLKTVGLDGCTRILNGKRSGVVGLPIIKEKDLQEMPQSISQLAKKIRLYRSQAMSV